MTPDVRLEVFKDICRELYDFRDAGGTAEHVAEAIIEAIERLAGRESGENRS